MPVVGTVNCYVYTHKDIRIMFRTYLGGNLPLHVVLKKMCFLLLYYFHSVTNSDHFESKFVEPIAAFLPF